MDPTQTAPAQAPPRPEITAQFLYNPPDTGLYCHGANLALLSDGTLVAAWYAYPEEEHVDARIILARKPADGSRWSRPVSLFPDLDSSAGNPVLFEAGGKLFLLFVVLKGGYWTSAELMCAESGDGGLTWTQPRRIWDESGMMVRHPPVTLSGDALVLPAYDEKRRESVLLRSRRPFHDWQEIYRFRELGLIQPALLNTDKGGMSVYFRPSGEPKIIWRSHSLDRGRSWAIPIRTPLPNPLSGISVFRQRSSTVVVYNHTFRHQRHPLSLSISHDRGVTWSEPWHIDTTGVEVSYPSFLVAPGGTVQGAYSYNRRMIRTVAFRLEEAE